jgi:hypothetical protein
MGKMGNVYSLYFNRHAQNRLSIKTINFIKKKIIIKRIEGNHKKSETK